MVLLASGPACSTPCYLAYDETVVPGGVHFPLPPSADSVDCTVTLHGATGTAAFDCPAAGVADPYGCSVGCTPPAGLMFGPVDDFSDGVARMNTDGTFASDAGPSCTLPEAGPSPPSSGQVITISVSDRDGDNSATKLKNWLGGTTFWVTVQCGGTQVWQLDDQAMGQWCPQTDTFL